VLGERDRRVVMGHMVVALGWGGQARVVATTGASTSTVLRAAKEARGEIVTAEQGRQRHTGGGTKSANDRQPGLQRQPAGSTSCSTPATLARGDSQSSAGSSSARYRGQWR